MVKWRSPSPGTRSEPSLSTWSRVLATTARPIIAIGAVVILGSAVWLVTDNRWSDHTDWERHGPSGGFPHAGPQAPVDSVKVSNFPPQGVVYGGIAVQALQGSDTLTASILRTGKAFWRLRRAGHRIDQAAFDPENGSVFALWTSDKHGKEPALDVTLIDARKEKPGWATPLPETSRSATVTTSSSTTAKWSP